jgi:hypothetical protein
MDAEPKTGCSCGCNCDECQSGDCACGCGCCQQERKSKPVEHAKHGTEAYSNVRVNDTVGVVFLGVLAILLLVFLVRSNKRNRELLLEVIELRRSN